jgi:hypothetical protein
MFPIRGTAIFALRTYANCFIIRQLGTSPRRPSNAELDANVRIRRIDGIVSTVQYAIMWFSLVGISALFYLSTKSLAGQHTFADIGIKIIGDFKISEGLSYLFGAGGLGYGIRERKLRRETIERLSKRNGELEKLVDQGRTSSHLTTRGTTNPEDRR